jgi:putative heme-binding domain-containing protein
LDGLIYWCKGAFALQRYDLPGGKHFSTRASHVFRAPPDHSVLEPVLTCGMDNPVGVVFTLSGEPFMCGTFLMHPEAGKRDGVVHAVYGGVYGKPNDVLQDHPKTGDLLPIMTHLGAAAPCSIIRYESTSFGPEYRDNLIVCCFNLHKLTRHALRAKGATFETVDSDFLVSDSTDFHPTDVIEDADGSLLVIDTGGWYKLCCPTSQLSKPDVLGAIYRVRRKGAAAIEDPRGLALDWEHMSASQATSLLEDRRPAVRKRGLAKLGKLGVSAVPDLMNGLKSNDPENRARVIWALTRIEESSARAAVRRAFEDHSELVRQAAAHSSGLWRDRAAESRLLDLLPTGSPAVQRAAAEALGRIGDSAAVDALLAAASKTQDRFLAHSLIYALIEIDAPAETAKGLKSENRSRNGAALIALDQMNDGGLNGDTVAELLGSADPSLRRTCLWVAGHHPDWGAALAGYFKKQLESPDLIGSNSDDLQSQLAEFSSSKPVQDLTATRLKDPQSTKALRQLLLRSIAQSAPAEIPSAWVEAVKNSLDQKDEELQRAAIAAAEVLGRGKPEPVGLAGHLGAIARDTTRPQEIRLAAAAAMPPDSRPLDNEVMNLILANLDTEKPVLVRTAAAGVLSKSSLTDDQLIVVAERLKSAGPLEITKLLGCFEQDTNTAVGTKLVQALTVAKSRNSLRPDVLEKVLARFPAPVQDEGKALVASLSSDTASQRTHLEELLASLGRGDIRRGQALFNSQKAACSSCHTMGYLGGRVGPDLTTIGQVRTERDLLESIVYPSASFVRSFEPYIVKTKGDDEYSGVLRKDNSQEIVLATGPATEVRIARGDIVDMRPGTVSVMPAGLEQQLSRQELADLVAFLKGTKWGAQ